MNDHGLQDDGAIVRIPNKIQKAHQQQGLWPQ